MHCGSKCNLLSKSRFQVGFVVLARNQMCTGTHQFTNACLYKICALFTLTLVELIRKCNLIN